MFKEGARPILIMMASCITYCAILEPSNSLSIIWHFLAGTLLMFGIMKFSILTIILSFYGGITFFTFQFFPSLKYCTTIYVFMTNCTFLGSVCISWLVYPPEVLLFKPKYFPRLYWGVMVQFAAMVVSFFLEITVENPYNRKTIYIEGVAFIFL